MILAAGRGKRLGALTADRPKPMLPIGGRPALEIALEAIASAGVERCLLVVGYRAEAVQSYFADGSPWGWVLEYVHQETPAGTGAALALASNWAEGDSILAVYADIVTDPVHYLEVTATYRETNSAAVIGINPMDDPSAGGAVIREGNRITQVIEKPPAGASPSRWNLAGINAFGPAIWPALDALTLSPRGEYELTDAISALIAQPTPVLACELHGYWSDIGTPESLAEADAHFAPVRG